MSTDTPLDVHQRELAGGQVRLITLARPAQRNPIDKETIEALRRELELVDDDDAVRSVVITGAGDSFSAGGDLRGYLDLYQDPTAFRRFLEDFAVVCGLLEGGSFTSIAMVNGVCVAGGLELALACDFIVAADVAKIGDGHLNFGQLPGAGGSQRLCRAIGFQHAKDLLLTGRLISGAEAATIGLVTEVVPAADLEARVMEIAESTTRHSPLAVKRMKELIVLSQGTDRDSALRQEIDVVTAHATTSEDAIEGLRAFVDRRPPRWTGR